MKITKYSWQKLLNMYYNSWHVDNFIKFKNVYHKLDGRRSVKQPFNTWHLDF